MKQSGLFGLSEHLKRLSAVGDPLETMERVVDFKASRPLLEAALAYSDGSKGGRPPYDRIHPVELSITHKCTGGEFGAELDVHQARPSAPYNGVSGWRIVTAREISAQPGNFTEIVG